MDNSLISVIVPCYNQAQYLDECLQSVLDQTYQDWECIIVNDGSPDNTAEVAKRWLEKDARFKYFYKENGGLSSARNFGIDKASGEWILPLDCDDYISNDYLDLAKNHFDNQNLKVIYCEAEKFGEVNEKWNLPEFSLMNLANQNLIFCCAFFRKTGWIRVGGYDENLKKGLEDWELWINILKHGGVVLKLENICFYYRIKKKSMLGDFIFASENDTTFKYIENKHFDFFSTHTKSLHYFYHKSALLEERIETINKRFFFRCVNKIYSIFNK